MATLVCFHAHPDDEAIATGGLMLKASDAGHRVILVCATRGEEGEPVDGVLAAGEELWERRMVELGQAAAILGAEAPRWLGYQDSGMMGEPTNDNPACFWQADVDEASTLLAEILREVEADVVTFYDDHGGYGHPDHIQVHRVGKRASEIAGVVHTYESTMNRTRIQQLMAVVDATDSGASTVDGPNVADMDEMGTPEENISFEIDVSDVIERKKQSMVAHASQIGPDSFFLNMPDEAFTAAFGSEWFNLPATTDTGGPKLVDLLPGL